MAHFRSPRPVCGPMRTHGPYTHSEMAVLAIMALALAAVLPHAAAVTAPAARAVRAPALDALQRSSAPRHGLRLESAVDADGLAHARLLLRSAPAAVANFSDGVARPSGYGQLRVWTDPSMKPHIQFYAAGFAEVRWPPSSQFSPPSRGLPVPRARVSLGRADHCCGLHQAGCCQYRGCFHAHAPASCSNPMQTINTTGRAS
jgi:hypothetical protein